MIVVRLSTDEKCRQSRACKVREKIKLSKVNPIRPVLEAGPIRASESSTSSPPTPGERNRPSSRCGSVSECHSPNRTQTIRSGTRRRSYSTPCQPFREGLDLRSPPRESKAGNRGDGHDRLTLSRWRMGSGPGLRGRDLVEIAEASGFIEREKSIPSRFRLAFWTGFSGIRQVRIPFVRHRRNRPISPASGGIPLLPSGCRGRFVLWMRNGHVRFTFRRWRKCCAQASRDPAVRPHPHRDRLRCVRGVSNSDASERAGDQSMEAFRG